MEGYQRIKELYLEIKTENKDEALVKIVTYLMKQPNMSELYLKEEKNLKEMMRYIKDQAREKAVNSVAVIEDNQVYEWAVTYFSKSNDELGINKKITPVKTTTKTNKSNKTEETDKNQLELEF